MSGRIMTRMTTDVDAMDTFLQNGLITMVNAVLTLENVAGLRTAQAYRREGRNQEHFAELSGRYRRSRLRAQRLIALYFPFVQLLSTVGGALILFAAAGEVHDKTLTAGGLIAYLLYIDLLFSPVQQLSQVIDGYNQAAVGLGRIKDLLRRGTSTPEAADPRPAGRPRGQIEFRDVRFRYSGQPQDALSGVNLVVAGERGGDGGSNGQAGRAVLRRHVGQPAHRGLSAGAGPGRYRSSWVVRGAYLSGRSGTRCYGRRTRRREGGAAREVGAIEMIARLPGGFRHDVAERGRNLAAGQRQLIALARAYLVDPAILLLDEATAALDLASEAAVNTATERLTAKRTTLVVAHRLTTAARADRIVVMESGKIAEVGTHAELLGRGGSYAALWAAFAGDVELVA